MDIKVEFNGTLFENPDKIIEQYGLQPGGQVQKAIDNAVVRFMEDYWAFDTGTLAHSVYGQGSGILTYFQPYAHYMWMGEVYGPNYPHARDAQGNIIEWRSPPGKGSKHPTGRKFGDLKDKYPELQGYKKDKKPNAGAFPFTRMKADHLNDIIEEAKRVARDK